MGVRLCKLFSFLEIGNGKGECGAEEPKSVFCVAFSIRATLLPLPVITGWGLKALGRMNQPLEKNRKGRKRLTFMENHPNCIQSLFILTVTPEQRFELFCDSECICLCCACVYVCVYVCVSPLSLKTYLKTFWKKQYMLSPTLS